MGRSATATSKHDQSKTDVLHPVIRRVGLCNGPWQCYLKPEPLRVTLLALQPIVSRPLFVVRKIHARAIYFVEIRDRSLKVILDMHNEPVLVVGLPLSRIDVHMA